MSNLSTLIVDDEVSVQKAIVSVLKREQIDAVCANNSEEALLALGSRRFDVILLDIMLPGQDGFSLLEELRSRRILTPVIILSGRDEDSDQIRGLNLGADDYVTKPFSKAVLVSKIRAIARRASQYTPAADSALQMTVRRGSFTLHLDSQTALKDGREIPLSSKEFALLCLFVENPGTLLSKQEIFSRVWKSETPDDNSILVYIKRLRDKIEDDPSRPRHLTTVWGKGYQFFP